MRSGALTFKFDMANITEKARRIFGNHVGEVTLKLPFVSFSVSPQPVEKKVAREIVIRLKDRRVLSATECCDDCIDRALTSLQEIRHFLNDKQVDLADLHDGPLFILTDMMLLRIRQFLTFEQNLIVMDNGDSGDRYRICREQDVRQEYFDALEMLRSHIAHCLGEVAKIADMALPDDGVIGQYRTAWLTEAYLR
jgi:hypothetical protein